MKFKEITELFGGPTATSRALGMKSKRYVSRVLTGDVPLPPAWIPTLKKAAIDKVASLKDFINS